MGCRSWSAVLVLLATTVCLAQSAAPTRDVVMELTLAGGHKPQLRIADGGTGIVELPDVGKFGFVPRLQDGNVVLVDIFDLNRTPHQRLGGLEAVVGGEQVQSRTTPEFTVRIVRVVVE